MFLCYIWMCSIITQLLLLDGILLFQISNLSLPSLFSGISLFVLCVNIPDMSFHLRWVLVENKLYLYIYVCACYMWTCQAWLCTSLYNRCCIAQPRLHRANSCIGYNRGHRLVCIGCNTVHKLLCLDLLLFMTYRIWKHDNQLRKIWSLKFFIFVIALIQTAKIISCWFWLFYFVSLNGLNKKSENYTGPGWGGEGGGVAVFCFF